MGRIVGLNILIIDRRGKKEKVKRKNTNLLLRAGWYNGGMRILAVDPGFERMGIAVLERIAGKKDILLASDCLRTSPSSPFHDRLYTLGQEVERFVKDWMPEALAIETLFFNTNQKTAMHVAEARGTVIYEAKRGGLSLYEFTPLQVKIAITGHGRGDKKQIISMVPKLIEVKKIISYDDEYDAIAIGLTCLATLPLRP